MTTLLILLFATLAPAVVLLVAGLWMVRKLHGDVSRALGIGAIVLGLLLVTLAILLVFLVQTSTTEITPETSLRASPDMPVYSSIRELLAASDLVVVGTVQGVAAHEVGYGTAAPDERSGRIGIPSVFYEIAVTEKLHGNEA